MVSLLLQLSQTARSSRRAGCLPRAGTSYPTSGTAFIALSARCSVASLMEWRPLSIREICVLLVPMRRASSPWLMPGATTHVQRANIIRFDNGTSRLPQTPSRRGVVSSRAWWNPIVRGRRGRAARAAPRELRRVGECQRRCARAQAVEEVDRDRRPPASWSLPERWQSRSTAVWASLPKRSRPFGARIRPLSSYRQRTR